VTCPAAEGSPSAMTAGPLRIVRFMTAPSSGEDLRERVNQESTIGSWQCQSEVEQSRQMERPTLEFEWNRRYCILAACEASVEVEHGWKSD
jgi:hypothetical protein